MGYHALLQGIFPTQGSNLGLLHCKQILYHLSQHLREVVCWVPKVDGDVSFPKKTPWRTQAYGNLFYRAVDALIEVAAGCYGRREGSATRSATVSAPMQGARTGMRTGHDRRRAAFTSCGCCCCEVAQSCPTLCNPTDCSLPGSFFHGIFQARILEWVAISFSRGSS